MLAIAAPAAAQIATSDGAAWRLCVTENAFRLDDKKSDAATVARAIAPLYQPLGSPAPSAAEVADITEMVLRLRVITR